MSNEKRRVRITINNLLDKHCNGCQKKKDFIKETGKERVEQFCITECNISLQLKQLGQKLLNDPTVEEKRIKKWSNDEIFYLMKHVPINGIAAVARQLERQLKR